MQDSILDPISDAEARPAVAAAHRTSAARPRVTVVDDSPEFLSLLSDVLGEAYRVVPHSIVRSIDELAADRPDLLIIDLHCGGPEGGLTGWELLALARSHPTLQGIPAVVCSADVAALRQDRIRLVAYGDVQLVAKPFDLGRFQQVVDRMIRVGGGPRHAPEDVEYPPLADRLDSWREGRPLEMCPHGRVRSQGEGCSRCG
jgi:CheY-like chemotaxis protein